MTDFPAVDPDAANLAALALATAKAPAALTGAGVSTASGIPDFRSVRTGLWSNVDPAAVANLSVLHRDPVRFWAFYRERFLGLQGKRPNLAHDALATLEREGRLRGVITQNVDGLHQAAGSRVVLELHGNLRSLRCISCDHRYAESDLAEFTDLDGVPRCGFCPYDGNVIAPGIVLFGQSLPEEILAGAHELLRQSDCLLVIGSSLVVHPAAAMPGRVLDQGGTVIMINGGLTPYDVAGAAFPGRVIRLRCDIVEGVTAVMDAYRKIVGAAT